MKIYIIHFGTQYCPEYKYTLCTRTKKRAIEIIKEQGLTHFNEQWGYYESLDRNYQGPYYWAKIFQQRVIE